MVEKAIVDYCRVGMDLDDTPALFGEARFGRSYFGVYKILDSPRVSVYVPLFDKLKKTMSKVK